jgi:hypothetical protein
MIYLIISYGASALELCGSRLTFDTRLVDVAVGLAHRAKWEGGGGHNLSGPSLSVCTPTTMDGHNKSASGPRETHLHAAPDPGRAPETLLGARRPVSGLFRCITSKAGYFSQRRWTADSDGSLHPPLPGTTPTQTACPAATARPPTPTGSCCICTAGASAASAGEGSSAPGARFRACFGG